MRNPTISCHKHRNTLTDHKPTIKTLFLGCGDAGTHGVLWYDPPYYCRLPKMVVALGEVEVWAVFLHLKLQFFLARAAEAQFSHAVILEAVGSMVLEAVGVVVLEAVGVVVGVVVAGGAGVRAVVGAGADAIDRAFDDDAAHDVAVGSFLAAGLVGVVSVVLAPLRFAQYRPMHIQNPKLSFGN